MNASLAGKVPELILCKALIHAPFHNNSRDYSLNFGRLKISSSTFSRADKCDIAHSCLAVLLNAPGIRHLGRTGPPALQFPPDKPACPDERGSPSLWRRPRAGAGRGLPAARKDRQAVDCQEFLFNKVSVRPLCALCLCGGIVSCLVIIFS